MSIKDSEFKAKDNITLHYKNGKQCGSVIEGSIEIQIKKGQFIPEMFVKNLILHNPEHIDFESKDSVPQLSKDQKEKYGFLTNITDGLPKKEIKEAIDKKESKTKKVKSK